MQADWGKMEKERKKDGKQSTARHLGGFRRVLITFWDFAGITSNSKNNPNHKALTQVISILENWDTKRLNALLAVLEG